MGKIAALLMLAACSTAATAASGRVTKRVSVGGSTYRVTTQRGQVEVARKSLVVVASLQLRDEMREAVRQATGCQITDELMQGTVLAGKLTCAPR